MIYISLFFHTKSSNFSTFIAYPYWDESHFQCSITTCGQCLYRIRQYRPVGNVVSCMMDPQICPRPNCGNLWMLPCEAKGILQMRLVKILRWGDYPEWSGRSWWNHNALIRGRQEVRIGADGGEMMDGERCSEDAGRANGQGIQYSQAAT